MAEGQEPGQVVAKALGVTDVGCGRGSQGYMGPREMSCAREGQSEHLWLWLEENQVQMGALAW